MAFNLKNVNWDNLAKTVGTVADTAVKINDTYKVISGKTSSTQYHSQYNTHGTSAGGGSGMGPIIGIGALVAFLLKGG